MSEGSVKPWGKEAGTALPNSLYVDPSLNLLSFYQTLHTQLYFNDSDSTPMFCMPLYWYGAHFAYIPEYSNPAASYQF